MNLIIPAPNEKIDLSTENEQQLVQRARIASQIAGYKSIRHFKIAVMNAIVKQHPVQMPKEKAK